MHAIHNSCMNYSRVIDNKMEEYEMLSCMCGYHIYYSIWDSCVGKCSIVKVRDTMCKMDLK